MVETSTVNSKAFQDVDDLIGLLVDCPLLERLTLKNCLPGMLSESSGRQTIHLPRLSWLCLRGSSSRVTNLLKMLKLSSSTKLHLKCTSENTATHNDYHILPILSTHFNDVKFRRFKLNLDDMGAVIVASTSLPISPTSYTHGIKADSDAELSLSFQRVVDLDNRIDILRRACDVLCLSKLEFLSISFLTRDQFINWGEIFQHCSGVTTVQVYGGGTISLLQAIAPPKWANSTTHREERQRKHGRAALAQAPDNGDSDELTPIHVPIFPKLTSLLLQLLYFTDEVPGSGTLYDLVRNTVQRRKASETPLTTLCVNNCAITPEQAKALEMVVGDFRWDHDKGYGYNQGGCYGSYDGEYGGWGDDLGMGSEGDGGDGWNPE